MKFKSHPPNIHIIPGCKYSFPKNMILFHKHEFINLVTTHMPSNPKACHFISYVGKEQEIF